MKQYFVFLLLLVACSGVTNEPMVAGTIYPAAYLAEGIIGDKANVVSVVPAGSEPHSYEPTPSQIVTMSKADLYIGIGLEFDHIEDEVTSQGDMPIITLSEYIDLIEFDGEHHHEEHADDHDEEYADDHDEEHEEENEEHVYDPHFWVSPQRMLNLVPVVLENVQSLAPENSDYFAANAAALTATLQELDAQYQTLSSCERNDIIVNHAAFGYLAEDYGLNQHAVGGLSPDVEPTPQALADIIDETKELGVTHIFFEELASPNVIETIARETGTEVLVLNPAGGIMEGQTYESIMTENLNNLKTALSC